MRPLAPFDYPAEALFRGVVASEKLDGDRVLQEAMDLPATSCLRQRFCGPEGTPGDAASALVECRKERPTENAIIAVLVGEVPKGAYTTPGGAQWEFYLEDLPTEAVPAHCEIRLRHPGETEQNWPGKRGARDFVRGILAGAFRVVPATVAPP